MNQPGGQSENKKYTNSQELLKNELLAANPIPLMGVESLESNQQSDKNKEHKENAVSVFSTCLDKIVQKYPELE